jgi:dipeptidyl aminopeptidase/acylaminoacyl peptidase
VVQVMETRLFSAAAVAAALTLAASASGRAAAGRPMNIDDLIGAVRVTDPQLSADGQRVAFVRTVTDLESGKRNADIWSVPSDGSAAPKALIASEHSETAPRFSPDGRRLAFIASHDGDPQVYVADADGGNQKKITHAALGAQAPLVFSADGSRVAFVSDVYPDCPDDACNKRKKEEAEKNPVKVRRLTRLL